MALAFAGWPSHAWRADDLARAAARLGPRAQAAVPALQGLIGGLAGLGDGERLDRVNHHFNEQLRFRTDLEIWGQTDHWATPLEALNKGEGDCEDYAIAKYLSLIAGGMAPQRLRLVYVRARTGAADEPPTGAPHMVLAYHASANADPLILDNLNPQILPASRRPDLTPVFSFSADRLWQGGGADLAGDPLARLTRWRSVLQRAAEEGFR